MTSDVHFAIDEQNPWPGLSSFGEEAERFFNGRRNESAELRRLVSNAPLTVLFGASGLGKTSLLQAGLFPLARREHYLPVYVRLDLQDRAAPLIDQLKTALKVQLGTRRVDAPAIKEDECLWSYLHGSGLELWSEQNQLLTPLFVFDQFEEVFTLGLENQAAITRLRIDLADLIENRLPTTLANNNGAANASLSLDSQRYRVLLSFREDFLPAVEGWKRELPSILRNRLRLLPMSAERAFEAVHQTAPHLVSDDLARQIVRFVAAAQEEGTGKSPEVLGEMTELTVEPALLSLLCSGLNEKRKLQGKFAFDLELLAGSGQSIISEYYTRSVSDMPERVQRFIENELITERGFRKQCDEDDARNVHGVTKQQLRTLVDRRVLRIEPRDKSDRVELTHDLLTRVVREHRDRQREKARLRRQRRRLVVFGAMAAALAGVAVVFAILFLQALRTKRMAVQAQQDLQKQQAATEIALGEATTERTKADEQRRLATKAADTANVARHDAEREATIATARRLVAQAETLESQRPSLLPFATLLAVESVKRYPTLEADQFLRHGLSLLSRPIGSSMKHRDAVHAVKFSPDGAHIATASWDGTAAMWEATTGRQLFVMTNGQAKDRIDGIAFSPTGKFLATISAAGKAQIWDAATGQPVGQAIEHSSGPTSCVAFSPDERYLATVTDHGADVWTVDGNHLKIFSTPAQGEDFACSPLSSFAFSPAGGYAAAACRGRVRIWQVGTWEAIVTLPYLIRPGLRPPLHPIVFSANGKYLASADEVYEVSTGTLIASAHSAERVDAVAFSYDGNRLAMAAGNIVRVMSTTDLGQFGEPHHDRPIRAIAFSPDGNRIATASDDNTARVWELHHYAGEQGPSQEIMRLSHEGAVWSVDFSPDGKYLATASEDGTARVWRIRERQEVARAVYGDTKGPVAVSSDGRFLAIADAQTVRLREAASGRESGHIVYTDREDSGLEIDQITLSPDGHFMLTTVHRRSRRRSTAANESEELEKVARLWDAFRGVEVTRIKYDHSPPAAVFSPDAKRLLLYNQTALQVWDVAGNREVTRVNHERSVVPPIFSLDGRFLAICEEEAVPIIETKRWRVIRSLPVAKRTFRVAAFSPDGKFIATGSNDALKIWETESGREVKILPTKYATAIIFSIDGRYMAISNWNFYDQSDRGVRIWDTKEDHEIGRLQFQVSDDAPRDVQLAFSNDSRYLAAGNSSYVRVWDTLRGEEIAMLENENSEQLVFGPHGRYLVVGGGTTASVWSWGPEALASEACDRLFRNLTLKEWRQYVGDEPFRKTCPSLLDDERVPVAQHNP